MNRVQLREINQSFGGVAVLRQVSLSISSRSYVVLLGPSGCGKTTLLRIIAGLQNPDSGDVMIDNQSVLGLPPRNRNVAMVFQQDGLYPHRTVSESIRLGLNGGLSDSEVRKRLDKAVRLTGIESLLDRYPNRLSGGELRRAAIAKAIARRAAVTLLDEPLSALDGPVRQALQDDLTTWHNELPGTTIHVTHDGQEAMRIADRIAVIETGSIIQYASPENVFAKPESVTVARSIGSQAMNLIAGKICNGTVQSSDAGLTVNLQVDTTVSDQEIWIGIRPDGFRLTSESQHVSFSGAIKRARAIERMIELVIGSQSVDLRAQLTRFDHQIGDPVRLFAPGEEVHLFAKSSGRRIEPI